ncbi:MAG: permease-like cell division protein FtsX [Candidatus Pacebacteria bacterium]|jgi:cell division transport system permease protein|nr:permease-like cell division protein FtsX [Candidatus Paceibacterota bacterium]
MFWLSVRRIIRSGLNNFSRNTFVSFSSIMVVTITLSVIAGLIFLQAILQSSLNEIKSKVDVSIYFIPTAQEESILSLKSSIEQLPEVATVEYIDAEKALSDFREKHKDDYLTLQALDELDENPLGAYLNIKAKEASQYESIARFLEGSSPVIQDAASIIEKINYNQNKIVIDKLISIIDSANTLGFLVTLIFVIISIIITFNTIRLNIYMAREEIGVMRLVGAGAHIVRGPFMVEGALYGLIATGATTLIFLPITYWLGNKMTAFFGMNLFDYYIANFFQIFLIVLASGVILGSISSFLAVRKYLNK